MHLIGPLQTNQILACADAPASWLTNGENPTSPSFSYQKLFKKYPPAFFSEMGSIYLWKKYFISRFYFANQEGVDVGGVCLLIERPPHLHPIYHLLVSATYHLPASGKWYYLPLTSK